MRHKKNRLTWPLEKKWCGSQTQNRCVFSRVHNQPTQAKEGLWAEACLLGDAADRVQQQLHALSDAHRHLFQQVYTNDMDRFLDRVRSDQGLLGIRSLGVLLSQQVLLFPQLDYALGKKWSEKARKRQCLQVSYSQAFPLILRWGISMMHEQQMDRHDWHHVMAMYANGAAINYRIVAEAEVSHVAHIPESCVADYSYNHAGFLQEKHAFGL